MKAGNMCTGLFIVSLLQKERYRYSYGRAFRKDLVADTKLELPVSDDGKPDWKYVEEYIASLHSKKLTSKNQAHRTLNLNFDNWSWYKLGGDDGLFDISA